MRGRQYSREIFPSSDSSFLRFTASTQHAAAQLTSEFRSTIINETVRHCKKSSQSLDLGYAFFYCDFNNSASLDPTVMFGSLVAQLAAQRNEVPNVIRDLYERKHDQSRGVAGMLYLEDLFPLLPIVANKFDRTYVIIDGLDECPNRRCLLDALVGLDTPINNSKLHLLFTSRREIDIKLAFKQKKSLGIQNAAVAFDVELHVRSELEKRHKFKRLPEPYKTKAIQKLVEGAQGM